MSNLRLRQVALVARDLDPVAASLEHEFGLAPPYRDPGVGTFGLENVVYELGVSFLEVVAPKQDGTTAGRLLDKRGGDGGYMAIFQVADMAEARDRVAGLGVRTVWSADLDDIAGTHLHPKDVPGAIVSLDWAEPYGTWRWGGARWTGSFPEGASGGVVSLTVAVTDPGAVAARWAAVLGVEADGTELRVDGGAQRLAFTEAGNVAGEGIVEAVFAVPDLRPGTVTVGATTVRVETTPA